MSLDWGGGRPLNGPEEGWLLLAGDRGAVSTETTQLLAAAMVYKTLEYAGNPPNGQAEARGKM